MGATNIGSIYPLTRQCNKLIFYRYSQDTETHEGHHVRSHSGINHSHGSQGCPISILGCGSVSGEPLPVFILLTVLPVTGSSQGLGRALLDAVLGTNECAVATLRRPDVLASYVEKYPASQLLVLPLDVTSLEQIDQAFAKVKEHFGRIDVVVNNAGYGLVAEIEATPEGEARRCFETCFWGPFHICQRACSPIFSYPVDTAHVF